MNDYINIYCDESCHLLHDNIPIMALGAIFAPLIDVKKINTEIRNLKIKYNCKGELKWTKVSDKNIEFYLELVDLFAKCDSMSFRSVIIEHKEKLDHNKYNLGDHNNFYYKMYYLLLKNIIEKNSNETILIYIDIKDTKSSEKVKKLHEVLANYFRDFNYKKIIRIQQIRSNESELMQLCDFILGAIAYANRKLTSSKAKSAVVNRLEESFSCSLSEKTEPWESKFNIFIFTPRED